MSITIRQGDSWSYTASVSIQNNGVPASTVGWVITSKLMDGTRISLVFDTGWIDASVGSFYHKAAASLTAKLPVGKYRFNVKFTSPSGEVISSDPVNVIVEKVIS